MSKVRLVGINHVAFEVGEIDAALEFYGAVFELRLRGRGQRMAFIDIGDQFIALSAGRTQAPDSHRHVGIVVDDADRAVALLVEAGAERIGHHDFRDPWGNLLQIVDYRDVQFTKAPAVLRGMGLDGLAKRESALEELRAKNLAEE